MYDSYGYARNDISRQKATDITKQGRIYIRRDYRRRHTTEAEFCRVSGVAAFRKYDVYAHAQTRAVEFLFVFYSQRNYADPNRFFYREDLIYAIRQMGYEI